MTTSTALQPHQQMGSFLTGMETRMAEVMPDILTPKALINIVLKCAGDVPKLYACSDKSLALSVMVLAETGLKPGATMGHAYLIPRGNECTVLIGYKGLVELARRNGVHVRAEVVYQKEIDDGAFSATVEPPTLEHSFLPLELADKADKHLALAYAIAVLPGGHRVQTILDRGDIDARRKRSAASGNGPWGTDFAAMARKSAIRALLNGGLVPMSGAMAAALGSEPDIAPLVADPKPRRPNADLMELLDESAAQEAEYVEPDADAPKAEPVA